VKPCETKSPLRAFAGVKKKTLLRKGVIFDKGSKRVSRVQKKRSRTTTLLSRGCRGGVVWAWNAGPAGGFQSGAKKRVRDLYLFLGANGPP